MMRHTLALACLLIFLLPGQSMSGQESSADAKSALAELNRFRGTWEKQFTIYKSEWSPEEQTKRGTQTNTWILDDKHLQETGQDSDGINYMTVYSYDVAAKAYRASVFQSNGNSWQMSGQWDAKSNAFTWTHELGDGTRMVGTYKFVTPNQFKFSYVAMAEKNRVLFRVEGTGTRLEAQK
jgi:hypothetical protein